MASSPCTNCGALVQPGAAFCAECGTPVAAAPASPPPPPPPPPPAPTAAAPVAPTPPPAPPAPAPAAPAYQQPAYQAAPAAAPVSAAGRPPKSSRNLIAGALAILAVVVVVVGTFMPIAEFDLGQFGGIGGNESANGWNSDLNDGPIHVIVCILPLVMGILLLVNRARLAAKILLIISAVIGFFWVAVRFADLSGSLQEEGEISGAVVSAVADPGVGLFVITFGWVLVLVAGLIAKGGKGRAPIGGPYAQPYQPPPAA